MNLKRISMLAAMVAAGLFMVSAFAEEPKGQPAIGGKGLVGKPAPDFIGTDVNGATHKLADLKGKIVVLEWSSSKCPFVRKHVEDKKTMQNTASKFQEKGVVWLAVNSNVPEIEDPDGIKTFVEECKISYPIILDPDGKIGRAYGAKTTPHMFVIDKNGIVAYEGAIDNDPSLKEENAINYVETALQSLVDGSEVATKWTKSYGCSIKYGKPAGEKAKPSQGAGAGE